MFKQFVNSVIGVGILIGTATVHAQTDIPTATILCPVNETSGDIRWARAEIQFPDGFEFYGPSRKTVNGSMSLQFSNENGTLAPIVHLTLIGNHIRGERFDSPDYWLLNGVSEDGSLLRFNLEQSRQTQSFAFGEVYLASGQKLNAKCHVTLVLPTTTGPQKPRCHPRAPC